MSEKKTAVKTAKKTDVAEVAESVQLKCTVLESGVGRPIAGLRCAAGKVLKLSEAKATFAEKQGWVRIDGIA